MADDPKAAPGDAEPRSRRRDGSPVAAGDSAPTQDGRPPPKVNSIRPSRARAPAPAVPAVAMNPPTAAPPDKTPASARGPENPPNESGAVPQAVRDRFVQVGRHFHFPDGARAFQDRGSRLTTKSENAVVIQTLVEIARGRGWSDITVRGTERFRREAWSAATVAGLAVRGYTPTGEDRARLVRAQTAARADPETNSPRSSEAERAGREADGRAREVPAAPRSDLLSGRLIEHGRAPYQHQESAGASYFVTVETLRGVRTVWGVDLERALRESLSRPEVGDRVGLRAVRQDPITVRAEARDADGRPAGEREIQTHRNTWVIEKLEFFDAREEAARALRDTSLSPQRAVKERPELAGSYLYLRGAEEVAKRKIRDPEDQKRFVELVRSSLADSVARGEPLPAVRVRERVPRPDRTAEREVGGARAR